MTTSRVNLYVAAAVADMTASLFGYSVGFVGGVLVLPSFLRHFHLDALTPHELARAQSLLVTAWIVGAFVGVPTAIPICSRLGRRRCLLFSGVMYVVGAALELWTRGSSVRLFELGRFLNGVGVGAGTLCSPLYIAEISSPTDRGMLMSSYQVALQASALIGFWGAYAAHAALPTSSDLQWQIPVAIQLVPGLILLGGTFYITETPQHLAVAGTLDDVERALAWLHGVASSDLKIKRRALELRRLMSRSRRPPVSAAKPRSFLQEAVRNPIRKRLVVGIGLFVAQNMAGMNALNYYIPVVFMASFHSISASLLLTGIFGAIKLAAAFFFMLYCVRVYGNRFWLFWGTVASALAMLLLGCSGHQTGGSVDPHPSWDVRAAVTVLSVYVFAFAYGISIGPIAWNICGEIFPAHLSDACCAVTVATQWLFQIVVAAVTPILLAAIGSYTFIFYALCNLAGLLFYWACVPETRDVALGRDMATAFGQDVKDDEATADDGMLDPDERTALLAADRKRRRSSIALVV